MKRHKTDTGQRDALTTAERNRIKEFERENRHLRPADAGPEPSGGSVGAGSYNALAETKIGLFKTEVINRLGRWTSKDQVELMTLKFNAALHQEAQITKGTIWRLRPPHRRLADTCNA